MEYNNDRERYWDIYIYIKERGVYIYIYIYIYIRGKRGGEIYGSDPLEGDTHTPHLHGIIGHLFEGR